MIESSRWNASETIRERTRKVQRAMRTLTTVNGPPSRCPRGLDNSFKSAYMNDKCKYRNYRFQIRTAKGNVVNTSARGCDPENAKFLLWKRYPNAVIMQMREQSARA